MSELVRYEAARRALAAAVAVDEVLDVRNKSEALRHYARQAGDRELEIQSAQLRFRAEVRLGELLIAAKETGQISRGQPPKNSAEAEEYSEEGAITRVTLREAGIDHKLSSRAQRMAAMDAAELEQALARHAEEMRSGAGRVAMDLLKVGAEEKGRAHRRDLAQALSGQSATLPEGRVYPAFYVDCPWRREGGIGDRAYENHYPTMTWPEILAFLRQARDRLLPDGWVFFWIPRAHLLAPIEIEIEVTVASTGEMVPARVMMPLAAACAEALGVDYSTCFVWTKTDEDHPDVSGSGLIAWDQDELLLLFKRGRGLPKPAGSEKFGSNHRERPREHSRKPDFYRQMIASMVGCDSAGNPLPVLEMFARVDAEHPLPPNWDACGNQASAAPDETAAPIAASPVITDSPVIAEQLDQVEVAARQTFPVGHVISMTSSVVDEVRQSIATCQCGAVFVAPFDDRADQDAAIEAHWQAFDHLPEKTDGRGAPIEDLAEVPSDGGTVAAAVGSQGAAAAAEAFPRTELHDLTMFAGRMIDDDAERERAAYCEAHASAYARRGLVHEFCGRWQLTSQGRIRLEVVRRERTEREALFKASLDQTEFWEWRDLVRIAGREGLDSGSVRSLVGIDLAIATDDDVQLTAAGAARLAELEAKVDGDAPAPAATPFQLNLWGAT